MLQLSRNYGKLEKEKEINGRDGENRTLTEVNPAGFKPTACYQFRHVSIYSYYVTLKYS